MKLQSVRGMNDIAPPESHTWLRIEEAARQISLQFGYGEVRPPILEPTALFKRGVGEDTDIVEKEMYTFDDRSGDSLTLRPEGTASVVRAAVQHGWTIQQSILKLFYIGPMFRHERPQKGRYRQFYQYGVELFGVQDPKADAEVISMGWRLLSELGLKGIEIRISTLGTEKDRKPYQKMLSDILKKNIERVPKDFQSRIDSNPQRIFDHKDDKAQELAQELPLLKDHLSDESKLHFDGVCRALTAMDIPFTLDPKIVRGLDYYNHTAFEYVTSGLGQSQNAVGGGGRYDGLVEKLGGRPTPAVGLAMGLDRIFLLVDELESSKNPPVDVFVASQGEEASLKALKVGLDLRERGLRVETDLEGRSLKAQFKRADKLSARTTVILGDQELDKGVVQVKNMKAKTQEEVPLAELPKHLSEILQS